MTTSRVQEITPSLLGGFEKAGPTDPIEYYRRPFVGWLYRERINRGLRLLPKRRFGRALEIGYGSGAVQLALASAVDELHGLDLDSDPAAVGALLDKQGARAKLARGSVYELPYDDDAFDLAVSFSTFEHLHEVGRAFGEVARVLAPGGLFVLGMPRVDVLMEAGFRAIGFKGIEDHHVTTPAAAARAFAASGFRVAGENHLDVPARAPLGVRLYWNWLLERM
ncbi:MAG TPA: class I SAM-dependent methyltransferase [Byssovorax sp.]|jgi:SAM-dependent methyltransferase